MGAGDRSYLVRDNQIDVFKNRYGGVEVTYSLSAVIWGHSSLRVDCYLKSDASCIKSEKAAILPDLFDINYLDIELAQNYHCNGLELTRQQRRKIDCLACVAGCRGQFQCYTSQRRIFHPQQDVVDE